MEGRYISSHSNDINVQEVQFLGQRGDSGGREQEKEYLDDEAILLARSLPGYADAS